MCPMMSSGQAAEPSVQLTRGWTGFTPIFFCTCYPQSCTIWPACCWHGLAVCEVAQVGLLVDEAVCQDALVGWQFVRMLWLAALRWEFFSFCTGVNFTERSATFTKSVDVWLSNLASTLCGRLTSQVNGYGFFDRQLSGPHATQGISALHPLVP